MTSISSLHFRMNYFVTKRHEFNKIAYSGVTKMDSPYLNKENLIKKVQLFADKIRDKRRIE